MPIFFVKPRMEDVPGTGDTNVDPPIPPDQVKKYDVFRHGKSTPEATFDIEKDADRKMEELEKAETALVSGEPTFQVPKLEDIKDKIAKSRSTESTTTKNLRHD